MAILRRPMFRKGGSVDSRGTGITSGLDTPKRGIVDGPGGYAGDVEETYNATLERLKRQKPKLTLGDYLQIAATGAEIAAAPSEGGGIGGTLRTAAGPLANLGRGLSKSMGARDAATADLAGTLTGLQIQKDLKERGLDSKSYAATNKINLIRSSLKKISELEKSLSAASELEQDAIKQAIKNEKKILQTLYGRDLVLSKIIDSMVDEGLLGGFIESFKDKYGRDPNAQEIEAYVRGQDIESRADGGRVGYEEGGDVMMDPMQAEQPMQEEVVQESPMQEEGKIELSYDELRARLPEQITDDIVKLLSSSYQALGDFAQIQTQADVNAFNQKYQVNLVLPQEA